MPETPAPGSRPLAGIRVLDLTRVLSGPHCTRMLNDLGAEIIKVEPPTGDTTRFTTPKINGLATFFAQQNVGKRNISLDMNKPEAKDIILAIADTCDVVLENFRPGVADRLGLGYAAVSARNPNVVYASISGYGQTGPWVGRRAYAPVVSAEVGYTTVQAEAHGDEPVSDAYSHADVYTGMECAAGVLAALFQRERTGRGEYLDIAMAQTLLYVNEHVQNELWDGPTDENWIRSFGTGEFPIFPAANGEQILVSGHPCDNGIFQGLMAAAGREDLIDDPRMATPGKRRQHFDEIKTVIFDWAATVPDADTAEEILSKHKLATGQLRSVRDVCDSDWAEARDAVVTVSDRAGGTIRLPNSPWRFAGSDHGIVGSVKFRGEDNREVLAELLGYDDARLDRLEADGVLSSRIPAGITE